MRTRRISSVSQKAKDSYTQVSKHMVSGTTEVAFARAVAEFRMLGAIVLGTDTARLRRHKGS